MTGVKTCALPLSQLVELNAATVKVLKMPEVQERLRASGAEPVGNSPAQHAAEIKQEMDRMKVLVKKQNIQFDGS